MGAPLSDDIWVTADAAVYLLDALEGAGIEVWVAGGWGIDALVGRQTRQHRDLDVLLPLPKTLAALHTLQAEGFRVETDWFPVRFEMIDSRRRAVDVHPIRLQPDGGAVLEMLEGGAWDFDAGALSGQGVIAARQVRCLSATEQIRSHVGYYPTDVDRADVTLLAGHFGIDLPASYAD